VTEELVLENLLWKRGAIDGEERALGSVALAVQCARDEFLARSAFAEDQDAGRARRDGVDHLVDVPHLLGLPGELSIVRESLEA
jgi:hypothetical protein